MYKKIKIFVRFNDTPPQYYDLEIINAEIKITDEIHDLAQNIIETTMQGGIIEIGCAQEDYHILNNLNLEHLFLNLMQSHSQSSIKVTRKTLQADLQKAIAREDYEQCAKLRDQLKNFK